ncbi:MAG TPA: hypothetical protein PLJ35_20400 [Anaerolineae bacterium]|nr:hypothetical protein [Anaerolineae bacterium]HPL29868.1 hypothetical protein [Anaerolineae bacterium]
MSSQPDESLAHLQAELARTGIRLRRQVQRWQRAGQDADDAFGGRHVADAQAADLLARPLATSRGEVAAPDAEDEAACTRAEALAATAHGRGQVLPLHRLAAASARSRFALDALPICLAPTFDLRYERLYGCLQDAVTRRHPSVALALDLLTPPVAARLQPQRDTDEEQAP